jgi:hypothetical protein
VAVDIEGLLNKVLAIDFVPEYERLDAVVSFGKLLEVESPVAPDSSLTVSGRELARPSQRLLRQRPYFTFRRRSIVFWAAVSAGPRRNRLSDQLRFLMFNDLIGEKTRDIFAGKVPRRCRISAAQRCHSPLKTALRSCAFRRSIACWVTVNTTGIPSVEVTNAGPSVFRERAK